MVSMVSFLLVSPSSREPPKHGADPLDFFFRRCQERHGALHGDEDPGGAAWRRPTGGAAGGVSTLATRRGLLDRRALRYARQIPGKELF